MQKRHFATLSLMLALGIGASQVCFGQIKAGTITGHVTDSSGAVVPGAAVTVINEGTKVPAQTQTSGTGDYTVPFLEPGVYDVNISKEGFNTSSQTGINVGVGATVGINATLVVGRTATVVEVRETGAAALQTETSSVGDTMSSNQLAALPDINANPFYFATLQPNINSRWETLDTTSPMSFGIGVYAHANWSDFSTNGSAAYSSNVTLDGINIQGTSWNESDVSPNPDALQEVKTYTNDFDASLGRGQGTVALVTKSGTNNYHGEAFGRVRNRALNANTFINDVEGDSESQYGYKPIPKAQFNAEYWGGTFGGPIKKDKAFFFASWQELNHHTQSQQSLNVPMNNQAKGDFASPEGCPSPAAATGNDTANDMGTCVSVGGTATPIQLANPFVATAVPGLSGVFQHPVISGPAGISDLTQVADPSFVYYSSFYPAANKFPTDQYNDNNYFSSVEEIFGSNNVNSRVDLSEGKNNFYFTGGIEVGRVTTQSAWGNLEPPFYYGPNGNSGLTPGRIYDHSPYGGVGDTIALSPTLVIDAHVGVNRTHYINDEPVGQPFNHAAFGMPASYLALITALGEPNEAIETSAGSVGQWSTLDSAGSQHKNAHETNWDYAAGLTKVKGKWTIKVGGEYMDDFTNTPDVFFSGGAYYADGCGGCVYSGPTDGTVSQDTTAATSGLGPTGGGIGDLMMGAAWWDFTPSQTYKPAYLEQYLGLYDANTWKVTSHLTLNLGVRWDLQPGVEERRNALMSFDTEDTNPMCSTPQTLAAVAASGLPTNWGCQGTFWMPGVMNHSRRMWQTEYNNFAPRVGFAYRIHENTVVRGGYGISYLPANVGFKFGNGEYDEWPWGVGTTQNSFGATPAGADVYTMENPAASTIVYPPGANLLAPQIYGLAGTIIPYNYKNAYMGQFNLFLEHKVGGWLFSAGYTGTRGYRLPTQYYADGENSTLFAAPSVAGSDVITCYHAGLNCGANDSSVAASGGYLATGADPYSQQVTNPWNPAGTLPFQSNYLAKTLARGVVDGTYPLMQGFTVLPNYGTSKYNAAQFEAKHEFSHGLMADIFYVWSKSRSNSYAQAQHDRSSDTDTGSNAGYQWNQLNPKANYEYDLNDVPGRFVANIVYSLPFGAGNKMNPGNKVASYLVSGWRIGGTESDTSGFPLDITDVAAGSLDYRPNRVASEPLVLPKSLQKWYPAGAQVTLPDGRIYTVNAGTPYGFLKFNPDAFSEPVINPANNPTKYLNDTYWMGTSAVNYSPLRTPSINNLNLSLTRDFKLTERFTLGFQANMTNALNHPNIQTYTADLGSGELTPGNSSNIPLGVSQSTNSYGTHNLTTFDSRQVEFQATLKF